MLYGRGPETALIASLLAAARQGDSGVVVIRGEAGIGKTALLDEAARHAGDIPVLRGTGIETEAELPFAGLHQLLRPVLSRLPALPARQAEALSRAFLLTGRDGHGSDDRFLVGLAVLSLLAEAGPVLCLVDDAHWLDSASADALLFAARRLEAEGVVMLFAARDEADGSRPFPATGLPECRPGPLGADPAGQLADDKAPGLDRALRDRVLSEAAGNPLALTELLLAGNAAGITEPGPLPAGRRIRDTFAKEIRALSEPARLLLAAAEASGDIPLILDAAGRLGAGPAALTPAERAGLISHRTVGYHLYKAYPKLGISTRAALAAFFPSSAPAPSATAGPGQPAA